MDFSLTCVSTFPMYALPTYHTEVNTGTYLRKAITLQANSCHNLELLHMYDLHKLSDTQSILMYHSVVKVKQNCSLEFF